MSTEIAAYTPPAQSEIDYTWNLANKLCKTEFVPANLRGKPEAVLAVFLTGRELGIGPMQALRDIYPVNGRPALMATLMVNRVRALGHRVTTVKSTDTEAVVQVHRRDQSAPEPEVRWTLGDAKRAGLLAKENWQKYPTAMLWSRAAAAACRRDAGEALGGAIYTPEEIEDGQGSTTATWGAPEPSEQTPGSAVPTPRDQVEPGTNASVTGPGDTDASAGHEPPNAEASTSPPSTSPDGGDGKAGRGRRRAATSAGKVSDGGAPAAPDEAAEQAAFEQTLADDDPQRFAR